MAYQIEYAYTCHIGKIRNNNEDNFWCCGDSLEAQNQGMSHIRSGRMKQSEYPLLAVFDGMGGESCGEMAAFLAAESCGEHYKTTKEAIRQEPEDFLKDLCETMNQAICDYGRENRISRGRRDFCKNDRNRRDSIKNTKIHRKRFLRDRASRCLVPL